MAKFILYKKRAIEQYKKIKEISDIVSYSYKTNPVVGDVLVKELKDEINKGNFWLSINSKYTMLKRNFEIPILYFLQGEKKEELEKIIEKTNKFVVDNEKDLNKLLNIIEEKDKKILLFLRVKIREHTINTGKYFVYGFKASKVIELINELKKNKNITLGIHFHRKTQNVGEWYLKEEFEELFSDYLDIIKYVNIGGGFPWIYANSKPNLEVIFNKVREFKSYLNNRGIKLITEPGRFIAAPSVDLEAEIISTYNNTLILDCSLFNAYMDTYLMGIRLLVEGEIEKDKIKDYKEVYSYLIKGCTPDSYDIFRYRVFFPKKLKEGDKLILKHCGAYNFHIEFNDLPKIKYEIR